MTPHQEEIAELCDAIDDSGLLKNAKPSVAGPAVIIALIQIAKGSGIELPMLLYMVRSAYELTTHIVAEETGEDDKAN